MKKHLLIVFLAVFSFNYSQIHAQVNAQDSLTLIDLYNSTDGANWNNPWILSQPVSTWQGITLDNLNNVFEVILQVDNLSGKIPPSLSNLKSCISIILDNNKLTDTIPASLGDMPSLLTLDLPGNQLTGKIPATLGHLGGIHTLELSNNQLSDTIPASLGNLPLNGDLDLSYNQLTGKIPPALGTYQSMFAINLEHNQLTGTIPDSLGHLIYLGGIDLSFNQFTGTIPSSLQNCQYVQFIEFSNNKLSGNIPPELGNLKYAGIDFSHNQLTGSIPASLGGLNGAVEINLSYNQLTDSIPSSLGNIPYIGYLYLNNNALTGSIPSSLGNLKHLDSLHLNNNQLSDTVPASLENISAGVDIQANEFIFNGMEGFAQKVGVSGIYAPQAYIPLHKNGNFLSVTAGGTLSNNTYNWYNGNALAATITGDSTYTIITPGIYSVAVTNFIATKLTLYSDSIYISSLPVTLLEFTATKSSNESLLKWSTTYEINAYYFEVQRSIDGIHFTNIGRTNAEESIPTNNYTFIDNTLPLINDQTPTLYYRLQMFDRNGSYSFSNIRKISNKLIFTASIYPNPVKDNVNVMIASTQKETAQIEVISMEGKTLLNINTNLEEGASSQNIDLTKLFAGTYFMNIITGEGKMNVKFVKE